MVRFRRDPAGRKSIRSRRLLLWVGALLLLGRFASGQVMAPGSGAWVSPNSVFNEAPAWNGPQPAFGPSASQPTELLPVNGDQEQGALQNLSFSQTVGDFGSLNVYGSPDPETFGAGAAFNAHLPAWLYVRDLQAAVYANPEQTVVSAGSTFTFYTSDHFGIAGRALAGATVDDDLQDQFHFTGDAFAGFRLPGEIWLKGGILYDMQDDFYKYGPTFGAVIMADAKHPITVDFAYGMGQGDLRSNQAKNGFVSVADDDVQVRVGTYLTPALQLGLSGNWARWDNDLFRDDSGIGGFARLSVADLDITFDITDGNLGTRGFVNVAYVFGGPNRKSWHDGSVYVDRPQDWLTRPVIRDASLRVQEVVIRQPAPPGPPGPPPPPGSPPPPGPTPLVGNITQVACAVQVNPSFDQQNPGVVDPGDGFNMVVTLGNGSAMTATNISVTNITVNAPFVVFNSPPNEVISYPNLGTGAQAFRLVPTAPLGVNPTAPQGASFNVDFDVMADGQVRRFRCPVTLGVSGNATPASPAIPLN